MDQHRHYYNQNNDMAYSRVYINRNFNRNGLDGAPTSTNSNVMYFNRNFAQNRISNQNHSLPQRVETVRPKIHVNPNFIRPKVQDTASYTVQASTSSQLSVPTSLTYTQPSSQQLYAPLTQDHQPTATVSKSRYCLVRQNEKVVKPPETTPADTKNQTPVPYKNTLQTVKLNKYKLVSLSSVKKSLITDKAPVTKLILPTQSKVNETNVIKTKYKIRVKATSSNTQSTRYKYVRRNSSVVKLPEIANATVRRISITHNKSITKTVIRPSKKLVRGAMKKNNIPCPLFRKYGMCLRLTRGHCDFLHDKKHVSICRKFLKGACHEKNCLLSHDLTVKKMPTCYFFLQGNCTKEGCPYLHVKLNEKAKICPDFLKGYCEKGDKCILRHVNVSKKSRKVVKPRKSSSSTNRSLLIDRTKVLRKNTGMTEDTSNKVVTKNLTEKESVNDQRYFRDAANIDNTIEDGQCDHIKPTRCKLGILPSFIQL